MKLSRRICNLVAAVLFVASVAVLAMSLKESRVTGDTRAVARRVTRIVEKRMNSLDGYMEKALAGDSSEWMDIGRLPQDMVIYRYCSDTLQSWCNEFSVSNDNIKLKVYVPFISNPRTSPVSPLSQVSDSVSFVNMGPKWYLTRSASRGNVRVIAGLQILDMQASWTNNGINPRLHLPPEYSIRPLSADGGSAVSVRGRPQFEILCETMSSSGSTDSVPLWAALLLFISSALVFLSADRSLKRLRMVLLPLLAVMVAFYFWGRSIRARFAIFSPLLYAGDELLYSLGAVVIINLAILVCSLCVYMCRDALSGSLRSRGARIASVAAVLVAVAGILFYTQAALRSIILNSGISLEIFKLSELSLFCVVVYASFITMLMSVPLLLQTVRPVVGREFGLRYDAFSLNSRVVFSLIVSAFLVTASSVIGFRKEQDRMEVLANRLSFDRDIALELRLRSIEPQIAEDMVISALSVFNNTAATIQSRITDYYFSRNDQDYTVTAYVFNDSNNSRAAASQYSSVIQDGVPIADNSRFLYVKKDGGHSYYVGVFLYLIEGSGVSRVLIRLESKDIRGNKGYAGIFGITPPGKVTIPAGYSYARYEGQDLKSYRGSYAYPTMMDSDLRERIYDRHLGHTVSDGYTHFFTVIGDREVIVISRPKVTALTYAVSGIFVALLAFLVMSLMVAGREKEIIFAQSYYRSRISGVLLLSLVLTLVAMASVSVFFVYSRNDSNMHSVMSDKISSISAMIEAGTRDVRRTSDIDRREMRKLLEQVGGDTYSDITLYTPSGRLLMSTTPMVFERQLLGDRINGSAYGQIVYGHRRYWIQKERVWNTKFYSMYAPIMNDSGDMTAIICSPYNEDNYDFEEDAVTHSMTIVSLFLVFLLMALLMVSRVVDRMFKPLSEMSRKMNTAGLESLEYISYDRDDEISSIVQAYNRMVKELSDSSRKLAQAERDKAWSEMARQVAHEIKNPLTPMKLQIQRIIRLKQKNDPAWMERFDEASKVLLDHIDILTDTANEFSTFAKLYTEEPVEIALDKVIQEEISMFDSKDNIRFDFIGLNDVTVTGPKPQITRVFVNLINNSVQAIDARPDGHIIVSLRNSMRDGFYDIVFEDNGPGVSEENEGRLFTPNFTTKNGGSGLGLAISRSILERCGATISYSRSFSLGGACFTISYPKKMF